MRDNKKKFGVRLTLRALDGKTHNTQSGVLQSLNFRIVN